MQRGEAVVAATKKGSEPRWLYGFVVLRPEGTIEQM